MPPGLVGATASPGGLIFRSTPKGQPDSKLLCRWNVSEAVKGMLDQVDLENGRLTEAAKDFGELHLRILLGHAELVRRSRGERTISGYEVTDFGDRVGDDEIRWWVFHHDPSVAILRDRTRAALDAAQRLKDDAAALKRRAIGLRSYGQIVDIYVGFATTHHDEVGALLEYVKWLESSEPFGPSILFTYRVWGSSRRGRRYLYPDAISIRGDAADTDAATEIVFGLRNELRPVAETEYFNVLEELSSSADPETDHGLHVPEQAVVQRTSIAAMDFFTEYWEMVRDSLKNVLLDCESCLAERNLLNNVPFWRSLIRKVAEQGDLEARLWDLKETLDYWRAGEPARQNKEIEFCERVASFANESGGALVIGVTNRAPRQIRGVPDPEIRIRTIDDTIRRCSNLELSDFHIIPVSFPTSGEVCLVVAIAKTKKVAEVRDERGAYSYPIRLHNQTARTSKDNVERTKHELTENDWGFVAELNRFLEGR